jgi:fumarylacetoacetase
VFSTFDYSVRKAVRDGLIANIRDGKIPEDSLVKLDAVTMHLPFEIGGFSDFYCSMEHVQNVKQAFPLAMNQYTDE